MQLNGMMWLLEDPDQLGDPLLSRAFSMNLMNAAKTLISYGTNPLTKNVNKESILHRYCAIKDVESIDWVMELAGATDLLGRCNANGEFPLSEAVTNGNFQLTKHIVVYGASPFSNTDTVNIISNAIRGGNIEIIHHLMGLEGVKLACLGQSQMANYSPPLFLVCSLGRLDTVRLLINDHQANYLHKTIPNRHHILHRLKQFLERSWTKLIPW